MKFKIGDRMIGNGQPPLIISEIGINHGGDIAVAKEMVRLIRLSGGEIVKHQTHIPAAEMSSHATEIRPPNDSRSIFDVIADCSLTFEEEIELKSYAESIGLTYISTPFSVEAAEFLNDIGVCAFKIGSGEVSNPLLIEAVAGFGKPVILSTGMHETHDIDRAVEIFQECGVKFALLQCTNAYPSPPKHVWLRGMDFLRERFPNAVVGFSDHSIGPTLALAAVARGAHIVERHFTDSKYRLGPDIVCSMDPAELRKLILDAGEIFEALSINRPRSETEAAVYKFARSSVVAAKFIAAGERIISRSVSCKRPGTGEISGSQIREVIDSIALRDIDAGEQLSWSDLKRIG